MQAYLTATPSRRTPLLFCELDLLLQPRVLAPQPAQFRTRRFPEPLGGGRTRQLVSPLAQLVGAQAELLGDPPNRHPRRPARFPEPDGFALKLGVELPAQFP
jgi:hypothetical protein